MDGALGWISSLMESLGHLFPHLLHVQANELCVIFKRSKTIPKKPGVYWYWPVWSKPIKEIVVRQTFTLPTQTLTTKDRHSVSVRTQVVIEVFDALLAMGKTASWEELIRDVGTGGVKAIISKTNLDDLLTNCRSVDGLVTRKIRDELRPYGIEVVRAFFSDFATTRVVTLIKD